MAGHFLALLDNSASSNDDAAQRWRDQALNRQRPWYDAWVSQNPQHHTRTLAEEGLAWLQLLDMMSLWLCSVCCGVDEATDRDRESYLFAAGQSLETQCRFWAGRVSFEPWRFDQSELEIEANGWLAPVRAYGDATELSAARRPHSIRWRIVKSA